MRHSDQNPAAKSTFVFYNCLFLLSFFGLLAEAVKAEPTDFGDKKVPTQTLTLADDRDLGGSSARFDGTVGNGGQRLVVPGLDVMSPLLIHVLAKDTSKAVDASLHRYFWGKPDAKGSTGNQGGWQYRGRAHDEVGISLTASEPTPVYVLVWQGPAVAAAAVPTIVVDAPASGERSEGINLMTVAIAVLLAVIAFLLFRILRRSGAAAAIFLAVVLAGTSPDVHAADDSSPDPIPNPFVDEGESTGDKPADAPDEGIPNPFADEGDKPDESYKPQDPPDSGQKIKPDRSGADKPDNQPTSDTTGDNKLKPDPNAPPKPQDGDTKLKPDPNAPPKPQDGDTKLKPDPNAPPKPGDGDSKLKPDPDAPPKPGDGDAKLKPDPDSPDKPKDETVDGDASLPDSDDSTSASDDTRSGSDAPFDDRLADVYNQIRQLQGEIAANSNRISRLEFLIQQDREAVPNPGDGAPPISWSCESDEACQRCLANANHELSDLLINLDKLRIIYSSYMRYKNFMVGLGDSISGFHQLEQAAWYGTKLEIEQATINLQGAYDNKFDEFKRTLQATLQDLSQCDSADGSPTFSRESVLFENYVKAKYARDD
ncbi:MAG: hypothetical protein HKN77_07715 [Woeseiaceae bacterium]|nr:hypothetical protein [Woeseiaceae bacterium]